VGAASGLQAHGISASDQEAMAEGGMLRYVWLGATHMVTGYDHLLFLFGVIFFLRAFREIVFFITAFTVGHSITLLGATLLEIAANPFLIDAVIALSVIYKGFENLDGFKKYFKRDAPNLLWMVFGFGLIHGFGLSTRLQQLPLGHDGLVARILSFNAGVELGQIAALSVMLVFFAAWRKSASFDRFSTAANVGLILAGVGLFIFQISGYVHEHHEQHEQHEQHEHSHQEAHEHPSEEAGHGHGHEPPSEEAGHDHDHDH